MRNSVTRPVLTARATPGKRVVVDTLRGIVKAKIVSFSGNKMVLELVNDVPDFGKKKDRWTSYSDRVTVSKNLYVPKGCFYSRYVTVRWTA
jgi:hypothetical protein